MYMQLNWGKSYVYVLVVNAIRVCCSGHVVRVDKASGIRCEKWHSLSLIARSWEYKVHLSSKLVPVKNYWSNLVAKTCFQTLDLKLDCKCCFQTFLSVILSCCHSQQWLDGQTLQTSFSILALNLYCPTLHSNSVLRSSWIDKLSNQIHCQTSWSSSSVDGTECM